MNKGQVIGFAIILDRQLPVALKREADRGIRAPVEDRLIKFTPPRHQTVCIGLEIRGRATNIHKNNIAPDMRTHRDQRIVAMLHAVERINAGAANMRCPLQCPVQIIGPCVIGAGDGAAQLPGRVDKDHAAMPADILKHIDITLAGAHQQHGNAQKGHRPDHAWRADILAKSDGGPAVPEQGILLMTIHLVTGIARIRKAVCRLDRRENIAQIKHHRYPLSEG